LDHLKHRFIDFIKVAFCDILMGDNEFSGTFDCLKHRFLERIHVAFLVSQKAENEFACPIDP
jgi:hypothetical protein